jgi:hypothetical protein
MTDRERQITQETCRKRIVWLNWMMLGLIAFVYIIGYVKSLSTP